MKLKSRNFPHPVLHPVTDDIVKSHFTGNIIKYEDTESFLQFTIEFKLNNDTLNTLFQEDLVHLNVHFECISTMQRISHQVIISECTVTKNKKEFIYKTEIYIDGSLLNKKVDVNYFILSNQAIPDYTNSRMHPDFQASKFGIEKGDILALAITQTIHLEKEELVHTNSIFKIAKDQVKNTNPFSIAMNNNQIEIILPNNIHERIGQLKIFAGNDLNKILISMLYYPALLDVLHTIQKLDPSELEEYESLDWYRTLEKKIRTMNLDITNLNPDNVTSLSYNLLYESVEEPWAALEAVVYRNDNDDSGDGEDNE
ncbi:hypothetical protein ACIQ2D_04655 [Lysinibacillus sp. NPDC097287]|uniref:hypothetical protein n=1 Tax=Lysinibacillus sp. NPDC097287 TaxID=3364144 RepID=UPI003826BA99